MPTYRPGRRQGGTRKRVGSQTSTMSPRTPDQVRDLMGVRSQLMEITFRGVPSSRRFDGKSYFMTYVGGKGNANYRARQVRSAGYRARVVYDKRAGGYVVYSER